MFKWGRISPKGLYSIYESNKRINLWEGSVRSSKTISSIVRWSKFVRYEAPSGLLLMVGKTQATLKRNVIIVLQDMFGKDADYNNGTGILTLFGREVVCMGANDERSQEKIRGATIVGAYCDEITLYPESFFTMLLSRLSVKGAKLFGTTNPDSPFHWLKANYIDRKHELDLAVFHFDLDDNLNLDPDFVANLKKEYTGLWYKRFILGLWVLAEGTVYDMFNEEKHVKDVQAFMKAQAMTRFDRNFVAVDYGTNNPCTFALYGYNKQPPVYLQKEYYYDSNKKGRQKTDKEYGDDFERFLNGLRPLVTYVDPSAASFILELKKRGYTVRPAKNEVLDGIRFVSGMLHNNLYFIDSRASETIKEYCSYSWDAKAQKRGEDKPVKANDHAVDRDRYALFSHFYGLSPKLLGFNYR